ncbi:MAG: CPBP family intramembrane metalloprotease [Actinomycetota bacterium]|nr:CPBP family intramembrane metalloprotease [Actinomycetota bacterium]
MSLRSVPDGRRPVAFVWWGALIALLMLAATGVAVLSSNNHLWWGVTAIAVNLLGYAAVWLVNRPVPLRLNARLASRVGTESSDTLAPITQPIPVVSAGKQPWLRSGTLLLRSAAVGLGASALWSVLVSLVIHPRIPVMRVRLSESDALVRALLNSLLTSILEECGMATLILAVAGVASRFLPARWDTRSAGYLAIVIATVARTVLHVPLWGAGAIGRIGLSFVLAWLFWRTRRVWPLIVGHLLWDTLALETLRSPSLQTREIAAVSVLAWTITGFVIACVAISRSRRNLRKQTWVPPAAAPW